MKNIKCAFCDGVASEKTEKIQISWLITINQYYYKCGKCSQEFTTNEMDDKTLSQFLNNRDK
jgi:hypothetical protein